MNKKLSLKVDRSLKYFVGLTCVIDFGLQYYFRKMGVGVSNSGISFGMLSGSLSGLLNFVWLGFLIWFGYLILVKKERKLSILMIVGGGTINIANRLFFGSVWDYISLPLMPFSNNLSDILITGGVIMYMIGL